MAVKTERHWLNFPLVASFLATRVFPPYPPPPYLVDETVYLILPGCSHLHILLVCDYKNIFIDRSKME